MTRCAFGKSLRAKSLADDLHRAIAVGIIGVCNGAAGGPDDGLETAKCVVSVGGSFGAGRIQTEKGTKHHNKRHPQQSR